MADPQAETMRRAIERGLSERPADRWPSMRALLAALRPRRRGRVIAAVAAVLLVAGGALGASALIGGDTHRAAASTLPEPVSYWRFDRVEQGRVLDRVGDAHGI